MFYKRRHADFKAKPSAWLFCVCDLSQARSDIAAVKLRADRLEALQLIADKKRPASAGQNRV